ncbi:hypothetical protein EES46_27725 [Streptomyces sp. ADI98-10]|nr:hypothetical protein EES46_27725 [Streptomyces sp. ADI98-10]
MRDWYIPFGAITVGNRSDNKAINKTRLTDLSSQAWLTTANTMRWIRFLLTVSASEVQRCSGRGTSPWIMSDGLWERMDPLLPRKERRFRHPGRKPPPDRQVLCGILFVLHTGIQWEYLPKELSFGSGMTCWRRLRDWNEAGVRQQLHEVLLAELNAAARPDWSRVRWPTPATCGPEKGGPDGTESGRSWSNRIETPPDH